ncbi:MAG: acyloxyacyl hydrolase [Flavobacteriia bacterium]|nr:acyloxyacyl hydrolase [Flavobacteriia bacterium]NBP29078.1 acyloxyacyl hydrolase [Flavobacteriia bacterium]
MSLWVSFAFNQSTWKNNSYLMVKWNQGWLIPEYSNIAYLSESTLKSAEVTWLKRTIGSNQTEQQYRYPEYGFTLFYSSLGNRNVFGQELALYPFFRTYFFRGRNVGFFHQFGFGLGYTNRRFNIESNPTNISVGSHLNMHFDYQLGCKFPLSANLIAETGVRFSHFSNANMAEPNLGLNMLYVHGGIAKSIGKQDNFIRSEIAKFQPNHEFAFIYAAGGKHTRALQSTLYFTSSLSAEYTYRAFYKFFFGGGLDLFYDASTKTELSVKPNTTFRSRDNFSSGMHLSQEIAYGNFSFILQEGWYFGLPNRLHLQKMYNRGIIRWRCTPNFLIHITMKSHLHILDYPELGFGYYFKR